MKILKKPFVAILTCALLVVFSTVISINVKLNNKCEEIIDGFYESKLPNVSSIYADIVKMYELAEQVVNVADNYGIDTRELTENIGNLRKELNFKNDDFSEIHSAYTEFYSSLHAVEIALSNVGLSQRHIEYMIDADAQIVQLKASIDNSGYNESVRKFYKRFDRFPTNLFADFFDIEYPEYFA